jgi:hypothetical protein
MKATMHFVFVPNLAMLGVARNLTVDSPPDALALALPADPHELLIAVTNALKQNPAPKISVAILFADRPELERFQRSLEEVAEATWPRPSSTQTPKPTPKDRPTENAAQKGGPGLVFNQILEGPAAIRQALAELDATSPADVTVLGFQNLGLPSVPPAWLHVRCPDCHLPCQPPCSRCQAPATIVLKPSLNECLCEACYARHAAPAPHRHLPLSLLCSLHARKSV